MSLFFDRINLFFFLGLLFLDFFGQLSAHSYLEQNLEYRNRSVNHYSFYCL